MLGRSAESAAREARRARSSTSLSGVKGEASTGHPALFAMNPALELGRIPEGGGYPVGFVPAAARLMGCTNLERIVHVCSGSLRAPITVDIRPSNSVSAGPTICADARWLPFRDGALEWVLCDPPYSQEHAQELWGLGKVYPTPTVLMREISRALRPGGVVGLLHFVVPRLPACLERIGTYGVSIGPGYRMRAFTVARRRAHTTTLELHGHEREGPGA